MLPSAAHAQEPFSQFSGGEPAFEAIDQRRGLSSNAIYAVAVDDYGFAWFAGESGLHRYDGRVVRTIDRQPGGADSLESRTNTALAETRDAMWILSFAGSLQRLDKVTGRLKTFLLVRASDGARAARGTKLEVDAREQLWVGTDIGVFRLQSKSERPEWVAVGEGNPRVTAMKVAPDTNTLYIGTVDGRIAALDAENPQSVETLTGPSSTDSERYPVPISLAVDGDRLWVGTDEGLLLLETDKRVLSRAGIPQELRRWRLDALVVARDGTVWMGGSQHLGLTRYDPVTGKTWNYRHQPGDPYSLGDERISALALDSQDNLWIGLQSRGANRLRLAQRGAIRYRGIDARSNSFCAVLPRSADEVLVSLCGAGLASLNPKTGRLQSRREEVDAALASPAPAFLAHRLLHGGGGGVWLATGGMGFLRWWPDEHRAERYPLRRLDGTTMPDIYMNDALVGRDGRLWVATSFGLAELQQQQTLVLRDRATTSGLDLSGGVITLAEGVGGELWLGTTRGLVRYDPGTNLSLRYTHQPDDPLSLSDDLVVSLAVAADGEVWVGTQAGLNRIRPGPERNAAFFRYGLQHGLPDQSIEALVFDSRGLLWVGTKLGIAHYDPDHQRFRSFGPADGVPDAGVNWRASASLDDGSLWFGTREGLLRVLPTELSLARPQPITLGSYEIGGRDVTHLSGPQLPSFETAYDKARVRFVIAAFGQTRPLQYRMVGLDAKWQAMPPDLTVHYDPLPPTSYRFEVRQLGLDNRWPEPQLTIPVQVASPPWFSWWAKSAYAIVALVTLGMGGLLWRNSMALRLKASEMDRLAMHSRLQLLQAQVAPHFLYNTLANVQALVETGSPEASEVLDSLVAYLRQSVPRLNEANATVGSEIALVHAYLAVMAMRMQNRLSFELQIDESTRSLQIPSMMVLGLVENAVRHGIDPSPQGGRITVEVRREADVCLLRVSDTGVGINAISPGLGTGLISLRERLALFFGPSARLTVVESPSGGVVATVKFPAQSGPIAPPAQRRSRLAAWRRNG